MIIKIFRILYKVFFLVKENGTLITITSAYQRYRINGRKGVTKGINNAYKELIKVDEKKLYTQWIKQNERMIEKIHFEYQPLISIIMPTYNTNTKWLKQAINSVLNQNYLNWELCIADDASTSKETIETLKSYDKKYEKVKVIYRDQNGHISAASSSALSLASGDYIVLFDHDDMLASFALYEVVKLLNNNDNLKLIYSDEDKIDEENNRFSPHFKSDWNKDMFLSQNYISHLTVIHKDILDKTEGFRVGFEGSQDYDLLLQVLKYIEPSEIAHIPKILYHWRAIEGSTAQDGNAKLYTTSAGIKALKSHFSENKEITVEQGLLPNTYKVNYPIKGSPKVSIVIPTRNSYNLLFNSISSILNQTAYKNYELIVIDNQSTDEDTLAYLDELRKMNNIHVFSYDKPFNYAAINNFAVSKTTGEFILLLNNDTEVMDPFWLTEMLQHAQREEIGIVGAKLYYEDRSIQHAGVVLGIGGIAGHAHKYFSQDDHGYFSRLKIIQNYSAVTGACMLVKKSIYLEVGGLEEQLKVAFNDIDFCLKVLKGGYRNLWTPYAELIHYESKSRGLEDTPEKKQRFEEEQRFMKKRWEKELLGDRCYNPNLTLESENFTLRIEERS
ncbi:MAG TPA: glycosyltransferase family 2 protein [Campylobacterales bacterium]|nr:glycosyltransferase family 2 protein [Campylobacterales bacterium]HHS92668.1 glycosyltransferase family 2 protein [Campylobacterales bacterium]